MHNSFPLPGLASALLPYAFDRRDSAHDEAHLFRVWRNVEKIMNGEGGDVEILLASTLLHDCVWVDKGSPDRPLASRFAADKARGILQSMGWDHDRVAQVYHAIEAHSFSANIESASLEAKILQDADRLDAIGYIGVARCLLLTGERKGALYHPIDPTASERPLDEGAYALDHFQAKLLKLGNNLQTEAGRQLAAQRTDDILGFYEGLLREIM